MNDIRASGKHKETIRTFVVRKSGKAGQSNEPKTDRLLVTEVSFLICHSRERSER